MRDSLSGHQSYSKARQSIASSLRWSRDNDKQAAGAKSIIDGGVRESNEPASPRRSVSQDFENIVNWTQSDQTTYDS